MSINKTWQQQSTLKEQRKRRFKQFPLTKNITKIFWLKWIDICALEIQNDEKMKIPEILYKYWFSSSLYWRLVGLFQSQKCAYSHPTKGLKKFIPLFISRLHYQIQFEAIWYALAVSFVMLLKYCYSCVIQVQWFYATATATVLIFSVFFFVLFLSATLNTAWCISFQNTHIIGGPHESNCKKWKHVYFHIV